MLGSLQIREYGCVHKLKYKNEQSITKVSPAIMSTVFLPSICDAGIKRELGFGEFMLTIGFTLEVGGSDSMFTCHFETRSDENLFALPAR